MTTIATAKPPTCPGVPFMVAAAPRHDDACKGCVFACKGLNCGCVCQDSYRRNYAELNRNGAGGGVQFKRIKDGEVVKDTAGNRYKAIQDSPIKMSLLHLAKGA